MITNGNTRKINRNCKIGTCRSGGQRPCRLYRASAPSYGEGRTEEEKIVGVLHDVVEDSHWTFEMLEEEGFSDEIIDALRCITKQSEDEDYDHFISRVMTNPLTLNVKL